MKLLSVIMPSYNRLSMLKKTIPLILEQVNRNSELVELVICNNASTDGTVEYIKTTFDGEHNIRVVDYEDYVNVDESIKRSASNAKGKYFLLWGDDDIPSPMMIDTILMFLQKNPNIPCLVFNRLQGHINGSSYMNNLSVYDKVYNQESILELPEEFIPKHYEAMGFLSVNVIATDSWEKGLQLLDKDYPGYNWLAIMLFGIVGSKSLYVNFPLCAQRVVGKPEYFVMWPIYGFIGIPRLLMDCEKKGLLQDWKNSWRNYQFNYKSLRKFIVVVMRCSQNKSIYKPYLDEMCSYQDSYFRKMWMRLCINSMPGWVEKVFWKIINVIR